jgi:nucleotide-binding universal stress UspA family protein
LLAHVPLQKTTLMKEYRIKNILVPTDFSSIARHALQHAERIASMTGARITLLNVVEPFGGAFGTSGMLGLSSSVEQRQRAASTRRSQRIARSVMRRSHVDIDTLAVIGRIAPEILKAATRTRADLIVMGTHGATGFMENLLGSNTYRVASLSKTPLLSVHKKIGRAGYSHIVYPVREQRQGMKKFSHALMFARLFHASVRIIGLLASEEKSQDRTMRAKCAAIQKRFEKLKIPAETVFTLKGFLPQVAIRYGHAHPGALVVITQDSDFHLVEVFQGAFSKRVLHKVLSPVLTVPVP